MTASAPDRDRERAEAAASALTLRSRLRAALMDRAIAITASVTAEPGPGAPRKALGAVVAEGSPGPSPTKIARRRTITSMYFTEAQ